MTSQHGIVVQARHEPCAVCQADPEEACDTGCAAVHLCRVCLAAHDGLITYGDAASVMHGDGTGVFAGWDLVFDTQGRVMIAVLVLIAAILVITAVALALPPRDRPDPDAGLLAGAVYDVTQEFWPVTRIEGAPFEDAPRPKNVPGQGTPALPTAPMPPHIGGGSADAATLAGGSSPPAGDTLAPGSEPSGATGREPEPPLPPDLDDWLTAMALTAITMAEIRQALAGKDGA